MRAKAIRSPWPAIALALGLGVGAAISMASLARADVVASQAQPPVAQTADAAQTAQAFVCRAQPGSWCDLRDWSGMDRWPVILQSRLPN